MPSYLLLYPAFNITRIMYYLTAQCSLHGCFTGLSQLNGEMIRCLIFLYLTPWVYMALGLYFYEIIPQKYGIKRHWLFCIKKPLRRIRKSLIAFVKPVSINDTDVLSEISRVSEANTDRENYPLIVESLTKVKFY
jgi:hypothetical protein